MADEPKNDIPLGEFPELPGVTETAMTGVKAIASFFLPGADLLDLLKVPVLKRQAAWLKDVAEHLRRLETEKRLSIEEVVSHPRFVDAVVAGLESARGTRHKEKLDALRNAALNTALRAAEENAEQDMFMRLIDRLTVWHIRVLGVFADPVAWAAAHGLEDGRAGHSTESFFQVAFPDVALPYCKMVWRELHQAGLVKADETSMFETMTNTPSWRHKRVSDLGLEFLRFIKEP